MKVILTGDVEKLGKSGDLKDVSDGFARNFLIPRRLAVPAAGGEVAAQRIASTTLTLGVKVGEGGKLYGSIGAKDIADALGRRGIEVDRHRVDLEEPLKTLGTYKVAVRMLAGLTPEVTVVVEPKG
jgi:large subunit ribosomal protein L9